MKSFIAAALVAFATAAHQDEEILSFELNDGKRTFTSQEPLLEGATHNKDLNKNQTWNFTSDGITTEGMEGNTNLNESVYRSFSSEFVTEG